RERRACRLVCERYTRAAVCSPSSRILVAVEKRSRSFTAMTPPPVRRRPWVCVRTSPHTVRDRARGRDDDASYGAGAQPLKRGKALRPAYTAASSRISSMRSSWLYLATRSERAGAPVLIWPQLVATARSAMVTSSVSPERCDIMHL